jgi:hypothetical protein
MVDALGYAVSGEREVVVGVEFRPTSAPPDSWEHDPGLWWSAGDGRWRRAAEVRRWAWSSAPEGLHDVTAFRGGFVAVGQGAGPIACVSRDGRTWERRTIGAAGGVALDVAVVGRKVVAFGTLGDRLAAWSSRDGRIWDHVPLPEELTRLSGIWVSVAGGPDGEIAIAVHDEDESEVYIGRP